MLGVELGVELCSSSAGSNGEASMVVLCRATGGAALSSGDGGRTSDGWHKELRPVAGGAPVGCDGRRPQMLTEVD